MQAEVFATDLVIGESARWRDGRLWLSNWGAAELLTFDLEGRRELVTKADDDPVLHRLAAQRSTAHRCWS